MMEARTRRVYEFDDFQLDAGERSLRRAGRPVALPGKAFEMLLVLVEHRGRLITKDELFERVWPDQTVEESNLTVNMSAIRKALGEKAGSPRYITTVSGRGYRFAGDVREPAEDELTVESRTLMRVIVEEEEIERPAGEGSSPASVAPVNRPPVVALPAARAADSPFQFLRRNRLVAGGFALGLIFVAVLGFGNYAWRRRERSQTPVTPFQRTSIKRLTNTGKIAGAALSPDGRYFAYVLGESEGHSLWVQQVGTASAIRVLPPTRGEFWGLTFTPDGTYLYYTLFAGDKTDPELFRIPSLGGVSQKIPGVIASFITFAPDGKRFAYPQPDSAAGFNYLVVADADGRNPQILARKAHPNSFEHRWRVVSWSPDGETIACLVNHFEAEASYSTLIGINARDGTERPLSARRWYDVLNVEWVKDGRGLLVAASEQPSVPSQVWYLSSPEGEARRITNDLEQYDWLGTAAGGSSFVAVQTNTVNAIQVGELGAADFREIALEVGPLSPLAWTPEGRIVFRSVKDGAANLWTMEADGRDRRQLTVEAQVDLRGFCVSPDGKHLVFASARAGKLNLWRVDAEGRNLTRLTNGEADAHPRCSPDGQWVVYQNGLYSKPTLWRVPLAGGPPVRLTDYRAKWPSLSPDGARVAYFYMAEDKWRIGIISSDDGGVWKRLEVPATLLSDVVHWSKDGHALYFINTVGDVGNIWTLPLDNSPPSPVTKFSSHRLEDFALSPDGRRVALTRSTSLSDVVLIESLP